MAATFLTTDLQNFRLGSFRTWADTLDNNQPAASSPSDVGAAPFEQGAGAPALSPPQPELAPAVPPTATPAAPAPAPPPPAPVPSTPPPPDRFSPFDDTFKKYAGDLANDPQFISIVAAGTLAESGWNPANQTGDGGHSWGLFQMHDGGAGAGMGAARLDPDAASAVMVPKYVEGYRQFAGKLQGPQLAAAVAQFAERSADPSGSAYAAAFSRIHNGTAADVAPQVAATLAAGPASSVAAAAPAGAGGASASPSALAASPLDAFRGWADSLGQGAQQAAGSAVDQFRSWADGLTQPGPQTAAMQPTPSDTLTSPPIAQPQPGIPMRQDIGPQPTLEGTAQNVLGALGDVAGGKYSLLNEQTQGPAEDAIMRRVHGQPPLPGDAEAIGNAAIAVGGMAGPLSNGRPLFGRGGAPGGTGQPSVMPAPTLAEDLGNALQQTQYQAMVNQIRKQGWTDEQIAESLRGQGVPDDQIQSVLHPPAPPTVQTSPPPPAAAPPPEPPFPPTRFTPQGQEVPVNPQTGEPTPPGPPAPPTRPPGGGVPPEQPPPPPPTGPVQRAGITPETVDMAHQRIDLAAHGDWYQAQQWHDRLDNMLSSGAAPDEIARFLTVDVEGYPATAASMLRTVRTGAMAGGLNTEGKVLLSPAIQVAMRAPTGIIGALVRGRPQDIMTGLQGGLAGLAEGSADAMQHMRYGVTYRAALTGGVQGGYGFRPGIDVLGGNAAQRLAGTAALGLVRTHGAAADIAAGMGRGAAAAQGASPEQAAEAGAQWALRSGQYGMVGSAVARAFDELRNTNPALDVVGQILVPFYRVGYNVFTQGVERSPVGFVGRLTDALQGNRFNSGKMLNNSFGLGLAALGFSQAAQGNITGENPPDGAPRWSVRVAGQWVPLRALGPGGEALAQSAILYESARDSRGNVAQAAEKAAGAYVGHVYDDTWLRSVGDLLGMMGEAGQLTGPRAAQATRDIQYAGGNLLKSFIPQEKLGEQVLGGAQAIGGAQPAQPAQPTRQRLRVRP